MTVHLLTIDSLPACSLGCYGELRIPTPHFDRLAAQSLVCNQFYVNEGIPPGSFPGIKSSHWPSPELELPDWLAAARCWLSDEEVDQIFSSQDEQETPPGSLERMQQFLSAERIQLIQASAVAMAHDRGLGEWLAGMPLAEGDILVVAGASGDLRRLPEPRADWLAAVCDPVVHLPLLIHTVGHQTHDRVHELIQSRDLIRLLEQLVKPRAETVDNWVATLATEKIRWETAFSRALRTSDWLIVERRDPDSHAAAESQELDARRRDHNTQPSHVALFRKPEDIWEMLDVASQHPDLVEELLADGRLRHPS